MARTISKRLLECLATGLIGSVLFWAPACGQNAPPVTQAVARARAAGVPEAVVSQVLAEVYDAGFDPSAAARTMVVLAKARQLNFNLDPFRGRIEEGIAKRIAGPRIALALEERLQRQIHVSEQLLHVGDRDATAYQAAVVSLADGLEMGLTSRDVDVLVKRSGDAPVAMTAVAAEMWALLKQLDFDPVLTDQIITAGLAQKAFQPAWRNFPQIVVMARQKGVPDATTGAEALEGLQAGREPTDLLSRLGFTGRNLRTGPMGGN
jgi:hypothetical protein